MHRYLCTICGLIGLFSSSTVHAVDIPASIRWDFGAEETTPLKPHGGVHRDVPGPRSPDYPDFDANNTAVKLDGSGAHLAFDDTGTKSPFDFTNGDAITLEAWIQVDDLRSGENLYVVGKGRTGSAGFAADNQNWALRIREIQGKAGVSFLFATTPSSGARRTDSHWHRWTSSSGFAPGKGWHHIAVAYKFGDAKSIRGWIDGRLQEGSWDMGGATNEAPIVDDDAVWIGSSRGGAAANSFRGSVDAIAIHRQALDDMVMKSRYRFTGTESTPKVAPETEPVIENMPQGGVLFALREGMPAHNRWLNEGEKTPNETTRVSIESFLIDRLPQRFDSWGIRENWNAPVLVQLAADVAVKPGKRRFLMRVRGLSRLWVNGEVIARSKPLTGSPSGEEPMTPIAKPPLPGLRIAEHRQQEVFGEATIGGDGTCRIVLETLVGGKNLRTDPGEICLAVESEDAKSFHVVQAARSQSKQSPLNLTDTEITAALARHEDQLSIWDDQNRRAAAASQNAYWDKRHSIAREWVNKHASPVIPGKDGHPIDLFLNAKIQNAMKESAQTSKAEAKHFHEKILPILRDNCFRCHGDKENGGLRLNSRESALKAGDSESPAVVPGNASKSELIRRIRSTDLDERMPPGENALSSQQVEILENWITSNAPWPAPPISPEDVAQPALLNDAAFLRRIFLDTVGVPPSENQVRTFLNDTTNDKRQRIVDELLKDERWADHWMPYWQDVLAENPTLLNPSLNTTGPFRWFLYDALRDDKPLDRLVTELILLRGSPHEGGSAGFGIAADNDAPYAAKGQIIANAFLGIELQCARCHDSPYHSTKQRDLYALAAMFEKKSVTVPKTSRVPAAFFEKKMRDSLIKVSLKHDEPITPQWPFEDVTGSADDDFTDSLLQNRDDVRERLAALMTSPRNTRFAQVVVNRIWRRYLGAGLVEPVHDWEGKLPSHPELLNWLGAEFVRHNYSVKHIAKLILTSDIYQRIPTGRNLTAPAEQRFFAAPDRRRLTAEQIVDSLFTAAGRGMDVEEFTFDPDGRRASSNRLTLGVPRHAWMFASLANERDRPTLSLPRARAIADILEAFGWSGSRQSPRTDRETSPNVLQPGVLANSTASVLLTRATQGSGLAELALQSSSPEVIVDRLFLRYLSRMPVESERRPLAAALAEGFESRIVPVTNISSTDSIEQLPRVTWSNHLQSDANTVALELERRARNGLPPDPRLRSEWRETFEDVVWSIINIREFVWMP